VGVHFSGKFSEKTWGEVVHTVVAFVFQQLQRAALPRA